MPHIPGLTEIPKTTPSQVSNDTRHVTPQCKIVVYKWRLPEENAEDNTPITVLNQSIRIDVSSQIMSCSFSKTLGPPSGTFNFTLSNSPGVASQDWKDVITRGSWCIIYMSQEGDLQLNPRVGPPLASSLVKEEAKRIRCIGFIDRVAVKSQMNEKGAFDIVYEISGRDFGVIYEDTTIWHNVFRYEQILLDAISTSKLNVLGPVKIDQALKVIHDLIFYPSNLEGARVGDDDSLTEIALQWLLPVQMVKDLGFGNPTLTYWGALTAGTEGGDDFGDIDILNFSKTQAALSVEKPTDYLSGNAWSNLKRVSVPELHELFTETTDEGLPRLIFRPMPFAINKRLYQEKVGRFITLFKDLKPVVELSASSVITFDVGEEGHSRYNSFLLTVSSTLVGVEDNIAFLIDSGFPKHIQSSLKRFGFRPMHVTAHSIIKNSDRANAPAEPTILKEFNFVIEDYYKNLVFAETGSAQIIGNNLIKVGKVLTFGTDTPYLFGKRYYIEGYVDQFSVNDKGVKSWETSVYLSHGYSEKALVTAAAKSKKFGKRDKPKFDDPGETFTRGGEFTPSGKK